MPSTNSGAGVRGANELPGFKELIRALAPTFDYAGAAFRPRIDFGWYANVIPITGELGIAISTDGVGTKLLVAQAMGKYDTVGIDCVAMNANDIVCVGARPLAMVDYLGVEQADDRLLAEIGKGLAEGARLASISIPGGELAQLRDMVRGEQDGLGFDLVGTCIGTVSLDGVLTGKTIQPGDAVLGLASSGIHSNGFTLARAVLPALDEHLPELGRTVGEELLTPTTIYIKAAMSLLAAGIDVKAFAHITGDGLLNLTRVEADVSFVLDNLPEPPPIFSLIQVRGDVDLAEMYRVFNMGVGFVAVLPAAVADEALRLVAEAGYEAALIGHVAKGPKRVALPKQGLVGEGDRFRATKVPD
jgi:phosphoribosylformylglycinamidine cyclo-ligase